MNTHKISMQRKYGDKLNSNLEDIEAEDPMSSDSEIVISANKFTDCKAIPLKQLKIVLEKLDVNAKSDSDESSQLRRGSRMRKKPKTYLEGGHMESPSLKQTSRQSLCKARAKSTDMYEDEFDLIINPSKKPTELFANGDVEGQHMFGFKASVTHGKPHMARKTRSDKSLSAQNHSWRLNTPPKLVSRQLHTGDNIPKHVMAMIKKKITKQVENEQKQVESDFSESSSDDYCPEEDSSSTETEETSQHEFQDDQNSSASEKELTKEKVPRRDLKYATPGRKAPPKKDDDYVIHSEDYFLMHSNIKNITSDHTLKRIKNLQIMDQRTMEPDISTKSYHQSCSEKLSEIHKSLFDKWLYVLGEEYNILLYGVGSKRRLLESFQKEKLGDYPCMVVNGFFPSLNIRSIVESILTDMLEVHSIPSDPMDAISTIDQELSYHDVKLFLLIHNLDGVMLRNNKTQKFLSKLATVERVHILASVDHINAPLICDHSNLSSYKFTWWDTTSLLPYTAETSYETSLMVRGSGALALSSLRSVYRSLTSNAKGIYLILVQKQLDNTKTPHYQGMPLKDLYSLSREAFLVSSDIALRAQLTEFLDHKLVKLKRSLDGIENLLVPIENVLLQQFLDQRESH